MSSDVGATRLDYWHWGNDLVQDNRIFHRTDLLQDLVCPYIRSPFFVLDINSRGKRSEGYFKVFQWLSDISNRWVQRKCRSLGISCSLSLNHAPVLIISLFREQQLGDTLLVSRKKSKTQEYFRLYGRITLRYWEVFDPVWKFITFHFKRKNTWLTLG